MRILLVHNYYQKRGGEDNVFESEHELLKLAGHDVDCFTLHNDSVNDRSKLDLMTATVWNGDVKRQLEKRLRAFKPDVVHFHNTFPLISLAALYAVKDFGASIVVTLHNFRSLCPSANLYREQRICEDCLDRTIKLPAVLHRCYRGSRSGSAVVAAMLGIHRIAGSFSGLVDRYITLSEHSRSVFIRAGFSPDRLIVKPNFVPPPPPAPDGGARDAFALFVGRLVPEKGVSTLLDAWSGSNAPRLGLVIAGEGPLASEMPAADGRIRWVGGKSRAEIYDLMRRASLLVVPSEWYEPFGLVAVEAFANGLPVVAARMGALEELIDPGLTGLLFEPGDPGGLADAVNAAVEPPGLLARMGIMAREEYRLKYTPARNLQLLTAIYHDAIRQHAGHPAIGSVEDRPPASALSRIIRAAAR